MRKKLTKEQKREQMLKRIKEFRLLDDDFMTKCFEESIDATELVLRIVLDKPDIKVEKVQTQYTMKNIQGRSVRLDVYATDSMDKKYNIEVQRAEKGAGAKRARYNSSLIDSSILPAGFDVEELAETFVIFITEHDVMGANRPVYHIERIVKETGMPFGDEAHIIYVNGAYRDESPLGLLIADFACVNPADMHYKILADRARYFKEDEKGVAAMCKAMEDLCNDAKTEQKEEIAERLLKQGALSVEQIAECVGLDVEEVIEVSKDM